LVADAIREAASTEIAFVNAGVLRAHLLAGPITNIIVNQLNPFDNPLKKFQLSGAALKLILEHSAAASCLDDGRFLQVSGLSFTFDLSRSAGQRVISVCTIEMCEVNSHAASQVQVGGAELEPTRLYSVVTNSFLATGGDGYTLIQAFLVNVEDVAVTDRTAIINYIQARGEVSPNAEARITILGSAASCDDHVVFELPEGSDIDGGRHRCRFGECLVGTHTIMYELLKTVQADTLHKES
jgi:2',3'-cyclic-nucleotide 2'-phosphodiesterase (5'-nucleotidase family)